MQHSSHTVQNGKGRGPEKGRNLENWRKGFDEINWDYASHAKYSGLSAPGVFPTDTCQEIHEQGGSAKNCCPPAMNCKGSTTLPDNRHAGS